MTDEPEKHAIITNAELDVIYQSLSALRSDVHQWCRMEELEEGAQTPHPNGFLVSRKVLDASKDAFKTIRAVERRMKIPSAHQRMELAASKAKSEVSDE